MVLYDITLYSDNKEKIIKLYNEINSFTNRFPDLSVAEFINNLYQKHKVQNDISEILNNTWIDFIEEPYTKTAVPNFYIIGDTHYKEFPQKFYEALKKIPDYENEINIAFSTTYESFTKYDPNNLFYHEDYYVKINDYTGLNFDEILKENFPNVNLNCDDIDLLTEKDVLETFNATSIDEAYKKIEEINNFFKEKLNEHPPFIEIQYYKPVGL